MKLLKLPPGQEPVLARLRKICLALPDTSEAVKWGHPNFLVGAKIFAAYGIYNDRPNFGSKQTLVDQALLVEDERFFISPYVGKHGWVSMYTDGKLDWALMEDLIVKSYRLIAPKKLVAQLDGAPPAKSKAKAKATPNAKPKSASKPKPKPKRSRKT